MITCSKTCTNNGIVLEMKYSLPGFTYTIFLTALICNVMSYVGLTVC